MQRMISSSKGQLAGLVSRGPMDRRGFLGALTAAGVAGYGLAACSTSASTVTEAGGLERIGVQLYTVRSRMQDDVAQTLAAVAEIGYQEVETAGIYGLTPEQFRAELDRVGLVSPAGHYGLDALRRDLNETLATVETLGQQWVIVPSLGGSDRTAEGYRRIGDEFNRYAAAALERGLRFAYHNHDFEFEPLGGGEIGYDLLLAGTDPALVDMELDLFWAIKGGHDPIDLFERHPGRFPLCHVKDMADVQGEQRMVDVGEGEVDFAAIFAHANVAGLEHYIVEHDNPGDPLASIQSSYEYLRDM